MTFLVANIPPVKCFVRREFLYNRCLWYDVSLVPAVLKVPDFKIPTEVHSVENHAKWSAKDEWFYGFEELNNND